MSQWNFPPKGGYMEAPKKMYFQTMTKLDVAERLKKDDVIIIPVGSTENHGAAGPIGEDTFMVTRIAEMVAEKTGCTVAEPVWYGSHPFHHIGQPCTIPLPDSVFIDFLRAIITGFWNTGFRKQIFISLHGQEYSLPVAIQEWGKKYQVPAMLYFVDIPRVMGQTLMDKAHGGPYDRPFQHACEAEQSLSLALFPWQDVLPSFVSSTIMAIADTCLQAVSYLYVIALAKRRFISVAVGIGTSQGALQLGVLAGNLAGEAASPLVASGSLNVFVVVLALICLFSFSLALLPARGGKAPMRAAAGGSEPAESAFAATCRQLAAANGLSAREEEVLGYLAKGRSQPYIREELLLSKNTVATHVKHIYQKLDVHSRQELLDLFETKG